MPLRFCFVQPFPPGEAAAFLLPLALALFITTSPLSRECLISWRVNSKGIIAGEIEEGEKAREGGAKTQDTKKVGRSGKVMKGKAMRVGGRVVLLQGKSTQKK